MVKIDRAAVAVKYVHICSVMRGLLLAWLSLKLARITLSCPSRHAKYTEIRHNKKVLYALASRDTM